MEEQQQLTVNSTKNEVFGLSIRDLFYKYVRFLPVFVLSVAVTLFAAYLYLRYATPIYSASGTMLIKSDKSGSGDKFDALFGGEKSQNIQSEIEILRSRPLMTRVVEKLNLQFSYYAKGKIKTLDIYKSMPFTFQATQINDSLVPFDIRVHFIGPKEFTVGDENTVFRLGQYFKNAYGVFNLDQRPGSVMGKDYIIRYQPAGSVAGVFAGALQVAPKSLAAGILNIGIQSTNPMLSSDIINQLMQEYGSYSKELKNQTSDQTIDFIDARLKILGRELDSVQTLLLEYSRVNNIIDIERQSTDYFGSMRTADEEIRKQQLLIGSADFIDDYLSDKQNAFNRVVVPSSFGLQDATLNELINGYNQLQVDRRQLLDQGVPPANPKVIEKEQLIESVRQKILENVGNIKRSLSSTTSRLRSSSAEAQSQLKTLPYKVKGYLEIKRQVDNKQALFNLLQEKREETAIIRSSNIESSQIVEKSGINRTPVKPNRKAVQILAILLGVAIPALVIFASEVLNDKVSSRFDVEKLTLAPILGEVGHSYSGNVLIVNKTTRSMVAEQFRIIRSNLQYILSKKEKPTILVTSSFSGEGKSFISTNMGAVLALTGKKTIILEFDIRKPKVLAGLGIPRRNGITSFLVGKNDDLSELIFQVPGHENLYVLACGPIPPNPSELLLDPRVDEMFAWLKANFDAIIVDTAPVGMVSDAMTLGQYCDCSLYLVRQGHTFKKQVTLIDEFYKEQKLPRVSIVINDVRMKPGYGYYGYGRYGYGYGYGYGSYYEEEHPPKTFLDKIFSLLDIRKLFRKRKR